MIVLLLLSLLVIDVAAIEKLTKSSDTHPAIRGPQAAPKDPMPSIMAPTVALAFWFSFKDLWVP